MSLTSATSTSATMHNFPILRAVREGRVGETVILCLDTDERLTLSRREYESLGTPAAGEPLSEETYAAARRMADYRATLSHALHILECGDTTRLRLCEKLAARGHTEESIARVLTEVERRGYIDETRLAARQVILCAKRGWGPRRIFAYLVSRGIDGAVVTAAISDAEEAGDIDFTAARRALIETRRRRGDSENKIARALYHFGF